MCNIEKLLYKTEYFAFEFKIMMNEFLSGVFFF